MAEFKKLSEVEQLETASDNATVLIEEGGDIKRVPKSAVGGAGGYVIDLAGSYFDDDGYTIIIDTNYDELYDVLVSGGSVWVDLTNYPENVMPKTLSVVDSITNYGPQHILIGHWFLTDRGLICIDISGEYTLCFPNGSHNLDPITSGGK